jgi:hypothetical protein
MSDRAWLRSNRIPLFILLLLLVIGGSAFFLFNRQDVVPTEQLLPELVDYNYHIRPILSDRCYKCHGPDVGKREANLRLDTEQGAYAALKDDPAGHVIIPGNPFRSELYLRVSSTDTSYQMPPPSSNLAVTQYEVKLIEKWIKQGAKFKKHWAFIVPTRPTPPLVKNKEWPKNDIDRFVLASMEQKGLEPNKEADKYRLLKRLSIDITGLPPSMALQDSFLTDESPEAYEKMVDKLLTSKHYGEKMAVGWLDLARYADSHGYQDDGLRTMWPWRDWVIHAFNENYSYKQFVQWQLAGDLMPDSSIEKRLASGFNRNHKITQEGGVIPEEYRLEYVTDRTNTFGKAFLALTFECAKCHDHKFDPISQKEYYSSFAFFNQVEEKGFFGDITVGSLGDPPNMKITSHQVDSVLQFINKKDTAPVIVMIMRDSAKRRITRVLNRGVYDQLGDTVVFNTPKAILPFDSTRYPNNRLGLAEWLFNKENPLTARVYVNRIWQEFFGRGLVKTSGDFGMQGELPSHPELLDWLAVDFRDSNWDIKRLIKMIVMSATYRQSSEISKIQHGMDPENVWLSRHSRLRLTAEMQRDLILESSGLLVKEIGGPSVKTYQPPGLWEASTSGRGQLRKYVQDHGDSLYRRTIYTFIKRTSPPPALLIFDASSKDQCEVNRQRTSTPLQTLVLMNDPQVVEASRVLAERLMEENSSPENRINKAFRKILCREPSSKEKNIINDYYRQELKNFTAQPEKARKWIAHGEYQHKEKIDKIGTAALMQVVHALFNMDESQNNN